MNIPDLILLNFYRSFFLILYLINNAKNCFGIIKNDLIINDNISIFLK